MADPLLLLYRANWTQWCLSAQVVRRRNRCLSARLTGRLAADVLRRSSGMSPLPRWVGWAAAAPGRSTDAGADWVQTTQRILVAPGGRYRFEPRLIAPSPGRGADPGDESVRLILSNGESCWEIRGGEADESVADVAHAPINHIVRPSWLMSQLTLTATGTTEVAGRTALKVRGTPRLPADLWAWRTALLDWVDILIDAELGLVLRRESVFDGQPLSSVELADLVISPATANDPASFRPGDGIDVVPSGIGPAESNRYWRGGDWEPDDHVGAGRMALGLARGGVYLAARQLARPDPTPTERQSDPNEDTEVAMPVATPAPAPGPMPATPGSRTSPSDAALRLITHADMPSLNVTAEVHYWVDATLARRSVPAITAGSSMHEVPVMSGFLGAEDDGFFQLRDAHRTARLAVAMPDRYRIDFPRDERRSHPLALACDGRRLRKVYHNRVVASPPQPLPADFVRLVDPAWLLRDWPLSEAGKQIVGGRTAIRLVADLPRRRAEWQSRWSARSASIAILIDAELGIVLEQVSYFDDQPVIRYELRDVRSGEVANTTDFGPGIAPDLPVVDTNGDHIGDLDLPASVRAAGQVGAELVSGAQSALSWLSDQARRRR